MDTKIPKNILFYGIFFFIVLQISAEGIWFPFRNTRKLEYARASKHCSSNYEGLLGYREMQIFGSSIMEMFRNSEFWVTDCLSGLEFITSSKKNNECPYAYYHASGLKCHKKDCDEELFVVCKNESKYVEKSTRRIINSSVQRTTVKKSNSGTKSSPRIIETSFHRININESKKNSQVYAYYLVTSQSTTVIVSGSHSDVTTVQSTTESFFEQFSKYILVGIAALIVVILGYIAKLSLKCRRSKVRMNDHTKQSKELPQDMIVHQNSGGDPVLKNYVEKIELNEENDVGIYHELSF